MWGLKCIQIPIKAVPTLKQPVYTLPSTMTHTEVFNRTAAQNNPLIFVFGLVSFFFFLILSLRPTPPLPLLLSHSSSSWLSVFPALRHDTHTASAATAALAQCGEYPGVT